MTSTEPIDESEEARLFREKFVDAPPPGMLPDGKLNVVGYEPVNSESGPRVHIHRE